MEKKDIITAIMMVSGITFSVGIIIGIVWAESYMNNYLGIIDDLASQYIDNYSKLRDLAMPFNDNDTVVVEWGGYRSSQWFQDENGFIVSPVVSPGWTFWVNHTKPYVLPYFGLGMFKNYTSFYLLVEDEVKVLN